MGEERTGGEGRENMRWGEREREVGEEGTGGEGRGNGRILHSYGHHCKSLVGGWRH